MMVNNNNINKSIAVQYLSFLKKEIAETGDKYSEVVDSFMYETALFRSEIDEKPRYSTHEVPRSLRRAYEWWRACEDALSGLKNLEDDPNYYNLSVEEQLKSLSRCLGYLNFLRRDSIEKLGRYELDQSINEAERFIEQIKFICSSQVERVGSVKKISIFLRKNTSIFDKNQYLAYVMRASEINQAIEISKTLGLTEKQAKYVAGIVKDLPFKELCSFVGSPKNSMGMLKKDVCRKLGFKPVGGEADNYNIKRLIYALDDTDTHRAAQIVLKGDIHQKTILAKVYRENKDIADFVRNDPDLLQLLTDKMEAQRNDRSLVARESNNIEESESQAMEANSNDRD